MKLGQRIEYDIHVRREGETTSCASRFELRDVKRVVTFMRGGFWTSRMSLFMVVSVDGVRRGQKVCKGHRYTRQTVPSSMGFAMEVELKRSCCRVTRQDQILRT